MQAVGSNPIRGHLTMTTPVHKKFKATDPCPKCKYKEGVMCCTVRWRNCRWYYTCKKCKYEWAGDLYEEKE